MASRRYLRLKRYSNSARYRGRMLVPHGPVGPHHRGLDVAEDGVDPFEAGVFGRFRSAAGLDRGMGAARLCDGGKAAEPIGHGVNARLERRARHSFYRGVAEPANAAKHDLIGFAVTGYGNGGQERRPALAPICPGALLRRDRRRPFARRLSSACPRCAPS